MISLDPDSGESTPAILEKVVRDHGGAAGIYASVLAEGILHRGDTIELLD
jgi:MOSC domain-containing protein YiiM